MIDDAGEKKTADLGPHSPPSRNYDMNEWHTHGARTGRIRSLANIQKCQYGVLSNVNGMILGQSYKDCGPQPPFP